MGDKYFHTIKTVCPDIDKMNQQHREKLNNYIRFDFSGTNEELRSVKDPMGNSKAWMPLSYNKEIHQMNTSTMMKGNDCVIITVLCCEDEQYEQENQNKA